MQNSNSRSEGIVSHIRHPELGLSLESKLPKYLVWKINGAYDQENHRTARNGEPALKRLLQKCTLSEIQYKGNC